MARWRIYWNLHDSGNNDVEATDNRDAADVFRKLTLGDLLGSDENIAEIITITKIETKIEAGDNKRECPICGSNNIATAPYLGRGDYAMCFDCGAHGQLSKPDEWEKREETGRADDGHKSED